MRTWLAALLLAATGACATDELDVSSNYTSYDEFLATVVRDPTTGVYIVEGDHVILDEAGLRAYYEQTASDGQALAVRNDDPNRAPSADIIWRDHRRALSYCISQDFQTRYGQVVLAMAAAAADWEQSADVDFIHVPREDARCNDANTRVLFRVIPFDVPADGLADAFYPNFQPAFRHVRIDPTAFTDRFFSLTGILRHELGHVLGFVHEHSRPEGRCSDTELWRGVTPYDSASVMHYRQCGGTATGDLVLSARDREGATAIYGAPRRKRTDATVAWGDSNRTSIDVFRSYGSGFELTGTWASRVTPWSRESRFVAGDFDANGFVDMVEVQRDANKNTFIVYESTGSGYQAFTWATQQGGWSALTQWLPGDFDGDGLVDLAAVWNQQNKVSIAFYRSTGAGFESQVQWTTMDGGFDVSHRWVSGDFDGNRLTDIAAIWNDGGRNTLTVRRSTGGSFTHEHWRQRQRTWSASDQWFAGDFDGDGRSDLAQVWKDGNEVSVGVYRAAGLSFMPYAEWATRLGGWIDGIPWTAGDFDANGQTDLLAIWNDGRTKFAVRRAVGASFVGEQWLETALRWPSSSAWRGADVDGQ